MAPTTFFCRFILENTLLDKYVRFIVSIYPVVIWALAGVFAENYDAEEPSRNNIFVGKELNQSPWHASKQEIVCATSCIDNWLERTTYDVVFPAAALLAMACALFVARVILVVWKSIKKPLYSDASPEAMSPTEVEENLNSFYKWHQWRILSVHSLALIYQKPNQ